MKIDLQKAFDFVRWDFIKELLYHLKFPTQFITWIMAYITSVSYKVNVNIQQGEVFDKEIRQKQGDPLSPLLVILSMEYFTRLMKLAGDHPQFKFHATCRQIKLNNLMFADDVIIFSQAHLPTLQIIKDTLETFH